MLEGRQAPVTIDDGIAALRIAIAAHRAHETRERVRVAAVTESAPIASYRGGTGSSSGGPSGASLARRSS